MKAGPFSRLLQGKIPETRTYLLQSRRLATVCSCVENTGGRPVKVRVRHRAGYGSSHGAAILCGLFLSSQHCPSNPEGGGHQKCSDTSREPCPSLMRVNSRQMGSMAAGPRPPLPPPILIAVHKILVLVKYMQSERMNGWVLWVQEPYAKPSTYSSTSSLGS